MLCENYPEELATYLRYVRRLDFFETPDYDYLRKLFSDLCERKGYVDDGEFDWTGRNMSTPVGSLQANQDVISPTNRDRHRTGGQKDIAGAKNAAWSESKPSGIDGLGPRLTNENRHPSVQVVRGSTNIDLSRAGVDDDGQTADRSNAPIANAEVEVVDETKCCCFFKRKIKKKKSNRSGNKWTFFVNNKCEKKVIFHYSSWMLRKNRCQKLKKNEKKLGTEKETKKKFFCYTPQAVIKSSPSSI